jgi:flagella basal body P-ring formation protein FlgA
MISPATNLEGTIANTHIEEGSVILWNQVRAKPDNFDGDSVILLYNSGSLQIKAKGRLMSDAFIGDSVKVVSEATNSVLTGTLNEHSVVEVQRERK